MMRRNASACYIGWFNSEIPSTSTSTWRIKFNQLLTTAFLGNIRSERHAQFRCVHFNFTDTGICREIGIACPAALAASRDSTFDSIQVHSPPKASWWRHFTFLLSHFSCGVVPLFFLYLSFRYNGVNLFFKTTTWSTCLSKSNEVFSQRTLAVACYPWHIHIRRMRLKSAPEGP